MVSDQLIEQEQQEREREKVDASSEDDKNQEPLAQAQPQQADEKETTDQQVPQTDKALLSMISDLTEQINQLKLQMSGMPADTANMRPDFSFFTLDDQGNVIPGADLAKLFAKQHPPEKQRIAVNTEKKQPAKDQHENKQAYQQKYIAAWSKPINKVSITLDYYDDLKLNNRAILSWGIPKHRFGRGCSSSSSLFIMGASQSKTTQQAEPVIFYNPNVPLQV